MKPLFIYQMFGYVAHISVRQLIYVNGNVCHYVKSHHYNTNVIVTFVFNTFYNGVFCNCFYCMFKGGLNEIKCKKKFI